VYKRLGFTNRTLEIGYDRTSEHNFLRGMPNSDRLTSAAQFTVAITVTATTTMHLSLISPYMYFCSGHRNPAAISLHRPSSASTSPLFAVVVRAAFAGSSVLLPPSLLCFVFHPRTRTRMGLFCRQVGDHSVWAVRLGEGRPHACWQL
jgi:hypothetical protein